MPMLSLISVLGVSPGDVVSLVGAGGKTSLLLALAKEAVQRWGEGRVVITTTTHMFVPEPDDFPPLAGEAPPGGGAAPGTQPQPRTRVVLGCTLGEVLAELEQQGRGPQSEAVPVLAGDLLPAPHPGQRSKLVGVPASWVDEIIRRLPSLLVLVEADGAARRPLKAPADHEPVIPSATSLVLAVAGLDALGQPLDAQHVHRPERVARLTGLQPGQPITPGAVALSVWHPEGCGRGRPPAARFLPVVNKVDSVEQLPAAHRVAEELLDLGVPMVVLTTCRRWPVVREVLRGRAA